MGQSRVFTALTIAAVLVASVLAASTPASAELSSDETFFDPKPANSWGVDGLDPGSGNFQYFSPVFALEEIGDTMVVGGKFLEVTNGSESHSQPYLAAFDVDSGDWLPAFDPDVTWSVFDLDSDPARNRVFVGGEFPSVNGDTDAAGFAALDPATGELDPTFDVKVGTFGGEQPRVHSLDISGDWLYIGGFFSWIEGSDGERTTVSRLARVSLSTGIVDTSWTPPVSGGSIWALEVDEVQDRVLLGGPFRTVNTTSTAAFAMVEIATGELSDYDTGFGLTYFDQRGDASNYDFASAIAVSDNRFIIGGQEHRTLVTDLDLNVLSVHRTNRFNAANSGRGGDTQAIEISGNIAFVACHCWGQINREELDLTATDEFTDVRSVYALNIDTGELIDWFQPDFSGTAGPWALNVDRDGCLWVGTDATQSGQRPARGVVKLCQANNLVNQPGVTAVLNPGPASPDTDAELAIDGDFRTNSSITDFAISQPGNTPAITIDLGEVRDVDEVILWARTDEERFDLRNVIVWASPEPFPNNNHGVLRDDPNVSVTEIPGSHGAKRSLTLGVDTEARYIRVEIDFRDLGIQDVFQLAEIAVTGSEIDASEPDPITVTSTFQSRDRIVLRWDPRGPVDIYRDGELIGSDNDGWYTDTGLTPGTSYDYVLETPAGATADITVSTEGEPAGEITLTSTFQSRDRIVLRWDPRGPVDIYRDGELIGSDNDGWYTDTGLTPGTAHTYSVTTPDGTTADVEATTQP